MRKCSQAGGRQVFAPAVIKMRRNSVSSPKQGRKTEHLALSD